MRIGLIIYGSTETVSGGYLYDRKLVKYLRKCDTEVEIISLPWRHYTAHLLDNFSAPWKAQLRKQCEGLDLLLQDELNHPSLFWINRWLRRKFSMPIITVVHHLRSSEAHGAAHLWLYRKIERAYLRTVDDFIFNSKTTKASVEALLGRSVNGIVAYPAADHVMSIDKQDARTSPASLGRQTPAADGVAVSAMQHDFDTTKILKIDRAPLNVIAVGNVSDRKSIHTVIDALSKLPTGIATLCIAGSLVDEPYVSRLKDQIEGLDLTAHIDFLGRITDEDLCSLYQRSDVLAVPSYEGFGIVYLEAMAFGIPVIGSTAGAAHEIISHGENGFLITPHDSVQLAQHLLDIHQSPELHLRMSQAARNRYETHPTWEISMGTILQWLGAIHDSNQ